MIRKSILSAAAVALLAASPALAEEGDPAWDLSAELAVVSDYRFRGISLSDRDFAMQGGATLAHRSGAYLSVWSSTIAESEGGADAELDLIAGYSRELAPGLTLDVSATLYVYPSDPGLNYVEGSGEVAYSAGPATLRVGAAYAPGQKHMRDEFGEKRDNLYLFGTAQYRLSGTPVSLTSGVGYESGYFDASAGGGKWDWHVGAEAELSPLTIALNYVDSDARVPSASGRNLDGGGIVASLLLEF